MIVIALLFLLSLCFYVKFRRSRRLLYELADRLPGVGGLPIVGHTHWFIGGPEKLLTNIKTLVTKMENVGDIAKVWLGPHLYIVAFNLDDIQKILENCLQKDTSYKFLQDWLGNGLFVAPVDLWKSHRKLLLPIFHNRIIDEYIDVFGKHADVLVRRLEKQVGKLSFDVYKYVTTCMLDIVFETSMGEKVDFQNTKDNPYVDARNTVMSIINMRLYKPWLQPDALFNLTSYSKLQKDNINITHKITDEVITKKKLARTDNASIDCSKDILELLLQKNETLSNVQLREHIDSITIAGNDTTGLVISYVLCLLGTYQEEQRKVYNELISIFGKSDRSPNKEDLSRMEYLEMVIKETMRLYTVVPIIARKTTKEIQLSTCTLPPGVGCAILPFIMHRSKSIWGPDADNFNPERFLPERCATRHPCAYIPFSYGARNCIGRHFGMLVIKSIVANILRNYKIFSTQCQRMKVEILLFPVDGHLITIERRS